jgi:molybdate transport system substrate-binding protein
MRARFTALAAPVAALVAVAFFAGAAHAQVRVATSGTFTAAYLKLKPELERVTHEPVVTVATSIGVGDYSIPTRLARREGIDVVIVADTVLEELIHADLVRADSRVDLARSTIGIAVRAGAPKPDISTVAALRETLLAAKSVAYSASVSGTYVSTELFQKLGIAEQMAGKSHRIDGERVGAVVARGDAELGFQQISELIPIEGIEIVGPLPAEVQKASVFSAGVVAYSQNVIEARLLIDYLASPAAADTITGTGLEPLHAH